ncbi:uncharacterized protein [Brachyistius frenatus]|uniref:uncharacterized protein n=1 Tax=Brachyistius frenatus TaxID=100188 RepID=UPI0037E77915
MAAVDPSKSPKRQKTPAEEVETSGERIETAESGRSTNQKDETACNKSAESPDDEHGARVGGGGGCAASHPEVSVGSGAGADKTTCSSPEDLTSAEKMAEAAGGNQQAFDWSEAEDDDEEEEEEEEAAADAHTQGNDKCDVNSVTEGAKQDTRVDDDMTAGAGDIRKKDNSPGDDKKAEKSPAKDPAGEVDGTAVAVGEGADRGGDADSTVKEKKCRLVCKECGKRFNRREMFNLHRHFHAHEDELVPLTCKECGLTFQHRSSLIKHRNEHKEKEEQLVTPKKEAQTAQEGAFQCAECQRIFSKVDKLRDHNCSNAAEKPYHCPLCRQEFQFRVSVTRHMMSHSQESTFTCQECNQTFPNPMALRFHQRCHTALKPYECPECGMVFKHYSVMEDHRRKHADNSRSHLCNICGKTFKYSSLLHQHQYLHTGQKPFRCPECGKKFAFAQNMKAHCRQHRLRETNSLGEQPGKQAPAAAQEPVRGPGKENAHQSEELQRTFNCPLCPQTYCVPANLRAHMLVHEAEYEKLERTPRTPIEINWEKGHTCPHCPCVYRDESSLNMHLLSVHKTGPPYLDKLPAQPAKQAPPLSSDNVQGKWKSEGISIKSYKCSECSKTFRHRSVLELHMRIHSKDKPYQCKVCGKGFRFSSYLQQHLIIHTGKKPYKCPDCGKDFAFLQNMRTHQKLHQEKPFRCTSCRKGYSDETQLQHHMLSHNGDKPHKCDLCDKSFGLAYLLRDHMNTHTGERPHRCDECHKTFSWFSSLLVHQKIHARKRQGYSQYNSFPAGARTRGRGGRGRRGGRLTWGWSRPSGGLGTVSLQQPLYPASAPRDAELHRRAVQPASSVLSPRIDLQSRQQKEAWLPEINPHPVQWKVDGGEVMPVPSSQQQHGAPQQTQFDSPGLKQPHQRGSGWAEIPLITQSGPTSSLDSPHMKDSASSVVASHPASVPKKASPSAASEMAQHKQHKTVTWSSTPVSTAQASTSSVLQDFSLPTSYIDGAALWSIRPAPLANSRSSPNKPCQDIQQPRWPVAPVPSQKEPSTPSKKEDRAWDLSHPQVIPSTVTQPEKPWNGCEPQKPAASGLAGASTSAQIDQSSAMPISTPVSHGVGSTSWDVQTPPGIPKTVNATEKSVNSQDFPPQQKQVSHGWASVQASAQKVPISIQYEPHRFGQGMATPVWGFQSTAVGPQTLLTGQLKPGNGQELQQQPMVQLTSARRSELAKLPNSHAMMDEAAAAAASTVVEDGAENMSPDGDRTSEKNGGPSTEDTTARVFCCRDCGEAFREEAAYSDHRLQHPPENTYLDNQLDGLHDTEKDNETPYSCTLCSTSFVELNEFHLHMKNHDQISQKESGVQVNSGITKQQTYECPDCGKSYFVVGHFLNHQRSHRQPSKSVFHDLEHLKKKSFQCESCGRNYSRASALDAHRRCHEEKLVKSRNRSSGDAIQTAESVETKPSENRTEDYSEKLFKCACGKAFSAMMRLKTHQRFSRNSQCSPEEMKQKPKKSSNEFHCNECKKSFNGHIALFNHQRWHANHSDDSAKRFSCEECGKEFMTLTFYYRHQRTAHSDETPAKSFLHQVCQLQKKAFECKDCGLKFSRASALHSHQLHHTDVFKETEKEAQMCSPLVPQEKTSGSGRKGIQHWDAPAEGKAQAESLLPPSAAEEPHVNETDEDMESYEPGDFNVQVISASESEDEQVQDLNPDLELLCESDQEVRDDGDVEISPGSLVSKPEMDLKIVQIDLEQADEQCALIASEAESKTGEERFECPECYRWFSSPSSLRVHRGWHGIHKRRRQTPGQSAAAAIYTCNTCGHEASSYAAHRSHMQTHNDQNPGDGDLRRADGLEKNSLACSECGKRFSRLSALVSHQLHHPKRKQFQCPDCMMSYLHAASLFNHMKTCSAQKKENISDGKKEYNPKKTLLGPKIYHCEQCGKGFWSLGAYSHHKQSQTECAELRLRKGAGGSPHSVNGRPRSSGKVACPVCGRKFRHKGIMALHMRKHENGNHTCELCNRSFRLFSSLLRHQVVHSDQLLPPPVKSFQHQVEQLKKNTYSCPDCGKLFSRAKALQFHMKSHGYETGRAPSSPRSAVTLEDLQCATCLAHFSNKVSLRAHQKLCIKRDGRGVAKTEPSDNNFPCSVQTGTQGISDPSQVRREVKNEMDSGELKMENHTDVGNLEKASATKLKYKCKKCDRSFSVVGALNLHKRIHAEGYKSVAKTKLAISVMFKKPKQEEPSKGLFHCSDCGRRFMSNSALGSHKRWHKDKKCSRSLLKEDLKSVSHKAEKGCFQCKECGKQFFNHCVLQRHQAFNPQCQTRTEPEPDSNQRAQSNGTPERLSCPQCDETFVRGSLLAAHHDNEHGDILEAGDRRGAEPLDYVPEGVDVNSCGSESVSSSVKQKTHRCPLCGLTFAKARGLRAHKWQAHSKSARSKSKFVLSAKGEPVAWDGEADRNQDSPVAENATRTLINSPTDKGGKDTSREPSPAKSAACLEFGKRGSSSGSLTDQKKACLEIKQEPPPEIQTLEAADVPAPPSRLLEHTIKCLFKCDKCGKAFPTEEQLGSHRSKARSRPYCCALCCHGFWTENQLQQHLAWHDEVRCRLPNEVRYRLSAAMTSKPLKPNFSAAAAAGSPPRRPR